MFASSLSLLIITNGIISLSPGSLPLVGLAVFCITCVFFICAYTVCCQISKDGFFICLCFVYLPVFQSTAPSWPPFKQVENGLKLLL